MTDWEVYKNMKGDPFLQYIHNSQNKYQYKNVELPHEQPDAIQVPKLPGEFKKYDVYNGMMDDEPDEYNPRLNTYGEEEPLDDRFDRYRD